MSQPEGPLFHADRPRSGEAHPDIEHGGEPEGGPVERPAEPGDDDARDEGDSESVRPAPERIDD